MPEQLGGLGVRNPFISSFLVRDSVYDDPQVRMDEFFGYEKDEYEALKRKFEELGERVRRRLFHNIYTNEYGTLAGDRTIPEDELDTFMTMEEFTRWREATSPHLYDEYRKLMYVGRPESVVLSRKVKGALENHARLQPELRMSELDEETKWLLQLHSKELFERCGDLSMVDKNMLPLGILTILMKKKVSWQMVL